MLLSSMTTLVVAANGSAAHGTVDPLSWIIMMLALVACATAATAMMFSPRVPVTSRKRSNPVNVLPTSFSFLSSHLSPAQDRMVIDHANQLLRRAKKQAKREKKNIDRLRNGNEPLEEYPRPEPPSVSEWFVAGTNPITGNSNHHDAELMLRAALMLIEIDWPINLLTSSYTAKNLGFYLAFLYTGWFSLIAAVIPFGPNNTYNFLNIHAISKYTGSDSGKVQAVYLQLVVPFLCHIFIFYDCKFPGNGSSAHWEGSWEKRLPQFKTNCKGGDRISNGVCSLPSMRAENGGDRLMTPQDKEDVKGHCLDVGKVLAYLIPDILIKWNDYRKSNKKCKFLVF